jgi:hypothetical protein
MTVRTSDSTFDLAPVVAAASADSALLEEEVLSLFDRFREPLLRYTAAFGLSAADREDLIQEVFLALFRHLGGVALVRTSRDGCSASRTTWPSSAVRNGNANTRSSATACQRRRPLPTPPTIRRYIC